MKNWYWIAAGVALVALTGMIVAQQPTATPPSLGPNLPQYRPPLAESGPMPVLTPPSAPPVMSAEPKPEDLSIEELLDTVDRLRAQKAELDRKERAVLAVLVRKAAKMNERIRGFEVGPAVTPPAIPVPPPSVGSVGRP